MRPRYRALVLGALLASSACGRTHELLAEVDAGDGAANDAQTDAPYVLGDGGVVFCGEEPCECSNGVDDDDDDVLADGFDPECTGPYDDDEATFATREVKEGNPRCSDCFFDGNSGPDDGCKIATSCTRDGNASGGSGACATCAPTPECIKNCTRITPNGCDCFGCCQIDDGMQSFSILLADSCTAKDLANRDKCPRCYLTPDAPNGCFNPCGDCELCVGRTLDQLSPDCGSYDCEDATALCGGPNAVCGNLAWCVQGCCAPILL